MNNFPTGTITFLFSDLEDSTRLWETFPQAMQTALARHDDIVKNAIQSHNGHIVKTTGDGVHAAFASPVDAVLAALALQTELESQNWPDTDPLRARIGIHTGEAEYRQGDYYGTTLNRAARLMSIGHGGQVLLSEVTAGLVRDGLNVNATLADLGKHRLKGLSLAEQVFQVSQAPLPSEFPPLRASQQARHNLPVPATAFVGRQQQLNQVCELLLQDEVRLVTLSAFGGMGKTRLSIEIGHQLLEQFPDGVFFVDLAPITDEELVGSAIARTLGIREGGGRPPIENLKTYLADKQALLILDNFEQITSAASIVADLITAAPHSKILVTSRILLQIRGEHEYVLSPLSLPESVGSHTIDQLLDYEAVQLFVQYAQAAKASFDLTVDNQDDILAICRHLDGLPLALEIAAARIKLLPPPAILKRLDESLKLLVGGAKDLPTRQQTLRGAIDWSYQLLDETERTLFARLGVFVGGFSIDSAEAVCNPDGDLDVFSGIEALLNNSLIRQVETTSDEPRFGMLQTIHQFACEKLEECGELEQTRAAHGKFFAEQAQIAEQKLYGIHSPHWLKLIDEDQDNYRAALNWGLESPDRIEFTSHIAFSIMWFWYRYGHIHEGREWMERYLHQAQGHPGSPHEGIALGGSAMMSMWEGNLKIASERAARSVEMLEGFTDDYIVAMMNMAYAIILLNRGLEKQGYSQLIQAIEMMDGADKHWYKDTMLVHLANIALGMGNPTEATKWLDQAMPNIKRDGDAWQIAFALNNYGEIARTLGHYEEAENYYRQTAEQFLLADALGDQARLTHTFGYIELHKNNYAEAETLFRQSLDEFLELGNNRGIAECLAGLAGVGVMQGKFDWAAPLLSAAETGLLAFGGAWWPADRVEVERAKTLLKADLGEDQFLKLWGQGEEMDLDQAVAYALS